MILWFVGNTKAGKSTAATAVWTQIQDSVWLDGDKIRGVWPGLGFSRADRFEQNLRIARLAKVLDDQDFNVIVSSICPYRDLRKEVREIIPEVQFVFLAGGKEPSEEYPYEGPDENHK
jgi:adenylylsulfate kinase